MSKVKAELQTHFDAILQKVEQHIAPTKESKVSRALQAWQEMETQKAIVTSLLAVETDTNEYITQRKKDHPVFSLAWGKIKPKLKLV